MMSGEKAWGTVSFPGLPKCVQWASHSVQATQVFPYQVWQTMSSWSFVHRSTVTLEHVGLGPLVVVKGKCNATAYKDIPDKSVLLTIDCKEYFWLYSVYTVVYK